MLNFNPIVKQLQSDGHYKMAEALKTHSARMNQLQIALESDSFEIAYRAAEACSEQEEILSAHQQL